MSKKSVLKMTALAAALAAAVAPIAATAEVSGSLGISSQYLWRGLQLTTAPTVNGSLDVATDVADGVGVYTGIWTSSEAARTEYDLYFGVGGEVEGLSYDLSYIDYNYTAGGTYSGGGAAVEASDADFQEIHAGLGMAGFALDGYWGYGEYGHGDDSPTNDADNKDSYYTASYSYDKYGILAGQYDFDGDPEVDGTLPDFTHVDLSYALTDAFTFTASKIISQEDVFDADEWDDDVLFSVSYSFAL